MAELVATVTRTSRGMIFSAGSIVKILAGAKTQTRRTIKPQPVPRVFAGSGEHPAFVGRQVVPGYEAVAADVARGDVSMLRLPWKVGDLIYVKEAWWLHLGGNGREVARYCATEKSWPNWPKIPRSPLFMPRWASRITLQVIDSRIEPVQEISYEDAVAEGCPGWYRPMHPDLGSTDGRDPVEEFAERWDELNAEGGHPWKSNPWVQAITFRRVNRPEEV